MTLRRSTHTDAPLPPEGGRGRRPYRPPIGIPDPVQHRREATLVSVALHALLIILAVAPPLWVSQQLNAAQQQGPSGDGRAGGGGGGTRGTGGDWSRESLRYFAIPEASPPTPVTPEPIPIPKPEEKKPVVEVKPEPVPQPPPVATADTAAPQAKPVETASVVSGTGGGSGTDGTVGSGPGRGGGVGSGVGTGRGSGTGSGTGAGNDDSAIYPPTTVVLAILPLPIPTKVRPYKLVAYFEVDTLGNSKLLSFNPSNDNGYNRRVREMLAEIRFRPAVRADGRPVLDTAVVTMEAPRS